MKIGFFTNAYIPGPYGMEVSIESFRRNLEELGHKVFVFAPYYKGYIEKNPRVFRFLAWKISKEKEVYLPFPFLPKNCTFKEVLGTKFDIIHAHSPFTMGLFAKYISLNQKIPFVYTHHIQYTEYSKLYFKTDFFFPSLAKAWSKYFSDLADLVIAPSLKIKKLLRSYGVKKDIVVLPTGIDTKMFKKANRKRELRKKLGISYKTKILLFVARMEIEKNPLFLIQSFEELIKKRKDVILLMIGQGGYLKKLKKEVKKKKLEKQVIFLGKVKHKEIPFYYQGSDIFVFSSLTETQGITILEAEACGLPVVALYDDIFSEEIKNNENGFLVKKKDPTIFAKYILRILEDKFLYKRFSLASRKIAKSFSEKKQAKKLLELYNRLLSK
ncbi:glycosyltransferase [bacterium]|nr:glycosyltransferase [bacterium]